MKEEKSRLEQFKEFVNLDPNDTFSRYALGMEYMGVDHFEEAIDQFEAVIRIDPAYTAAFFQAGIAARKAGNTEKACDFLRRGIAVAEQKGDWHTRDEMKALLQEMEG